MAWCGVRESGLAGWKRVQQILRCLNAISIEKQGRGFGRNFPLLLVGQFLSAFGDQAILAVLLAPLLFGRDAGLLGAEEMRHWNTLFTVLLFVPCVAFAPLAGFCNDRFPKSFCLVCGGAIKLFGALLCVAGLFFDGGGRSVLQASGYFIVGVGTCLYGPGKYGVLPEILPRERLVRANGLVELLTLLAILGGVTAGSVLSDIFRRNLWVPHAVVVGIYGLALLANAAMQRTPENAAVRIGRSVGEFFRHLRDLISAPRTRLILAGSSFFWVIGAAVKSHLQPWGQGVLRLRSNVEVSLLAIALSVGVMMGSVLAGRLRRTGDLSGVPHAIGGLAAMLAVAWTVGGVAGDLGLSPVVELAGQRFVVPAGLLLMVAGIFAGLFLIPLNAALQAETAPEKLGKTVAVQNFFDYIGMCCAGAYLSCATFVGMSLQAVFLGLAVLSVAMGIWMASRRSLRTEK